MNPGNISWGSHNLVLFNILRKITITRMTTHGKFRDFTTSIAIDDLPEPELPAIPIILKSTHGGQ